MLSEVIQNNQTMKNLKIYMQLISLHQNKKNELFGEENITKKGRNGISPMKWDNILGKKAKKSFNQDDLIEL